MLQHGVIHDRDILRKFTGDENSTMLQHGVAYGRGLTTISPLSAGFPQHLMRPAPVTRGFKKPAGSRLTGGEATVLKTPG